MNKSTLFNQYNNTDVCRLCKRSTTDLIRLRDNSFVCQQCIDDSKNDLLKLKEREQKINKKFNTWDKALSLEIILLIITGLYFWYISLLYITILIAIVGYILGTFLHSRSESYKRDCLDKTARERAVLKDKFIPVFELFWDYPPDWVWRRRQIRKRDGEKCQKCGRKWYGSTVPFHTHHIIPIHSPESSHKLENLIFLCEICHANIVSKDHNIVRETRTKRLEKNRHFKNYKKRNWHAPFIEGSSVYW